MEFHSLQFHCFHLSLLDGCFGQIEEEEEEAVFVSCSPLVGGLAVFVVDFESPHLTKLALRLARFHRRSSTVLAQRA